LELHRNGRIFDHTEIFRGEGQDSISFSTLCSTSDENLQKSIERESQADPKEGKPTGGVQSIRSEELLREILEELRCANRNAEKTLWAVRWIGAIVVLIVFVYPFLASISS
jgi:hypothetical protein